MPESQMPPTMKKYAVGAFIEESTVEVIPTNWLVSKNGTLWPDSSNTTIVSKFIKDCAAPSSTWKVEKIKIYSFSNSFLKAKRKAAEALNTSHFSSDSEENLPTNKRKCQKPSRYRSGDDTSGSESESIITAKNHQIPIMPKVSTVSTSKFITNSQGDVSKDQNVQNQMDCTSTAIYSRLFQQLESISTKLRELNRKVDKIGLQVEKITNSGSIDPLLDYLPDDTNLPLSSVDELELLNEKIKSDKEFSATLVRFLHNAGTGKSERSFVLSITKRVLSQEVAAQFSRFGRKGKKSFMKYNKTLNVILGKFDCYFFFLMDNCLPEITSELAAYS